MARMRRAVTTPLLAAALAALAAGAAGAAPVAAAAPPERDVFPLVCNGQSYDVEVNGNGEFTPGRIVGSTGVIVPISFGDFHFQAVLPDGTVIEGTEPAGEGKGGGNVEARNPRPTVTCTFEVSFTLGEPQDGFPTDTVLTFGGEVTGYLTGR